MPTLLVRVRSVCNMQITTKDKVWGVGLYVYILHVFSTQEYQVPLMLQPEGGG